jgi:hypothetical protein
VKVQVDGWITAVTGSLVVNGHPIANASTRLEFDKPIQVKKGDEIVLSSTAGVDGQTVIGQIEWWEV